ncbi:uncharacterized protein LOC100212684 [Hydra vulgaris]|uniref:uncharacterized protein LOC100212684 n=1 Tax=Hydra vulgaris TaxID=6087 RepID=UPI00019243D9|nr:uncharacterized protein LOC100212684 [Hydra vulgaris]XP_047122319.1 uncharacterized protein LOC100212684 [Hydra vulgaris]
MAEIIRNQKFQYKLSELLKNDWYNIGINLDIEERDLESIRDDVKFKNSQEKAYGMLKCFINKEKPTLDKLKDAIKKIGKNALLNDVNNLEDTFLNKSPNFEDNTNKRNSPLNNGNDNQFPLTSKIVERVAYLIGDKYGSFGRHLGLDQYDIKIIKNDEQSTQARATAVIDLWIELNHISKWEQLKKELISFKRINTVEIIEKEFAYK